MVRYYSNSSHERKLASDSEMSSGIFYYLALFLLRRSHGSSPGIQLVTQSVEAWASLALHYPASQYFKLSAFHCHCLQRETSRPSFLSWWPGDGRQRCSLLSSSSFSSASYRAMHGTFSGTSCDEKLVCCFHFIILDTPPTPSHHHHVYHHYCHPRPSPVTFMVTCL